MEEEINIYNISNKTYDHLLQAKFCNPSQLFYVNIDANKFFNNMNDAQNDKLNILKNRKDFIHHDVTDIASDILANFMEAISMLDIQQRYPNISIREGNINSNANEYELTYTYHIFDNMSDSQGKPRPNPLIIPILGENIYLRTRLEFTQYEF